MKTVIFTILFLFLLQETTTSLENKERAEKYTAGAFLPSVKVVGNKKEEGPENLTNERHGIVLSKSFSSCY